MNKFFKNLSTIILSTFFLFSCSSRSSVSDSSSEISHPDDAAADADASSELDPADAAKKKKLKKSIITFGIVVAAIAVIAVIFFLIFGTSKDPSPVNPSSTDSNTYQDVDELINELHNN